jgi:GNAT superfamily N-acetyltransferase
MKARATLSTAGEILPIRIRFREEMNCQIVHDSIHRREGWTLTYRFEWGGVAAGFGSIAIAGPWKDKPTIFEFYVLPDHRTHVFELFDAFLVSSEARFFEVQSNDTMLAIMFHTYAQDIQSEKIVFADKFTTNLPSNGATLLEVTTRQDLLAAQARRQGGGEWILNLNGAPAGKGGILFHYNRPYGDIYMEISEAFRKRGYGSYLVQELKRIGYELGAIPAARCDPTNIASRRTLQKAGFVPFAHILNGSLRPA